MATDVCATWITDGEEPFLICGAPAEWFGEIACERGHVETTQLCARDLGGVADGRLTCSSCSALIAVVDVGRAP